MGEGLTNIYIASECFVWICPHPWLLYAKIKVPLLAEVLAKEPLICLFCHPSKHIKTWGKYNSNTYELFKTTSKHHLSVIVFAFFFFLYVGVISLSRTGNQKFVCCSQTYNCCQGESLPQFAFLYVFGICVHNKISDTVNLAAEIFPSKISS